MDTAFGLDSGTPTMTTNEPKKKTAAVGLTAAEGLKPSLLTPEVDTEVVATGRTHA